MMFADPGKFAYSYYDIYAQAYYDLFTLHTVTCFYLRAFSDRYGYYNKSMTNGQSDYFGDKSITERIKILREEFIEFDGDHLFKFHGLPCKSVIAEFTNEKFRKLIFFIIKASNLFSEDFIAVMEGVLHVPVISFTVLESPSGNFSSGGSLLL
jgi:hypothetical protein